MVLVVGLRPLVADLVEHLVRAEIDHATVVRLPPSAAVPEAHDGATVLVVIAEPAASEGASTSGPPPVTVISLEPNTGLAISHPLAGEAIPLGELTPGVLRWLAEGSSDDGRPADRRDT